MQKLSTYGCGSIKLTNCHKALLLHRKPLKKKVHKHPSSETNIEKNWSSHAQQIQNMKKKQPSTVH